MKIVKQSFEILPEMVDPIKQIAARSRICYKSEDKAKEDERPFLTRIKKHEPVFEMAVVSLLIELNSNLQSRVAGYFQRSKYLHTSVTGFGSNAILVTGSIRAWREWLVTVDVDISINILDALEEYSDFLFCDIPDPSDCTGLNCVVKPVNPKDILGNNPQLKRHKHVAVKFVTNRAVSHEMVRHRPCSFLQESQRYCRYNDEVVFVDPRPAFDIFGFPMENHLWEQVCSRAESTYLELLKRGASPQAARTVLPNSCKTEIIVYCNLKEWEHMFNRRTSKAAEPSMREQMIPLHAEFQKLFPGMFDKPQLSIG